ncbi:MAG: SRPBCC domain-containing protein [Candidatus Saccharibacteria bacterium]|nr:SRPBCC domain-containing protein [Rhodoferax sp.]
MKKLKMVWMGWMWCWVLCLAGGTGVAVAAPERVVTKTVVVNATLDQTWEAWTTRAGITSFFAPDAKIEARVGGPFQIYMDPDAEPGAKGADDMRFMALQPMSMLSFDWNAPPILPLARAQRTFVVVRLEAVSEKLTRVTLTHTGWGEGGEWEQAFDYFDRSWGTVLDNLKRRFDTGPRDWTVWLQQLKVMRSAKSKKQ